MVWRHAASGLRRGSAHDPTESQRRGSRASASHLPALPQTPGAGAGARGVSSPKETVEKVYNHLDSMHGVEAFVNAFQGASRSAIWQGLKQAGVADNTVLVFSELMDAKSLFLTGLAIGEVKRAGPPGDRVPRPRLEQARRPLMVDRRAAFRWTCGKS